MRLILLFTLLANTVYAQAPYLEWINPETQLRQRFMVPNYTLSSELADGSWRKELLDGIRKDDFAGLRDDLKTQSFVLKNGELVYITINGSQRVYAYDPGKKSLHRMDRTWNNGYNYNAAQFIRNDTIYSVGGYGFWHFNKLITYFDCNKKGWELIIPTGKGPETIVGGYQGYDASNDLFYSGASELFSDRLGDLEKIFDKGFYQFDFRAKEWTYLGELNSQLPFAVNRQINWSGKYFFHFLGEKLYILDPSKNKVWLVHDGKTFYDGFYSSYFLGDTIICFSTENLNVVKYSMSDLLKNSKEVGPMYLSSLTIFRNYVLGFVLLLLIGLVIFKLFGLKRKGSKAEVSFKNQELILLREFVKLAPGEYLTSNDINEIIGISDKGMENQRKIRTSVISQINDKIAKYYAIYDAIERSEHPEDKRLKLYQLKKSAQTVVLRLASDIN